MARAKRNIESVEASTVVSSSSEGLPVGVLPQRVSLGEVFTYLGGVKGTTKIANGLNVIEFYSESSHSVLIKGFEVGVNSFRSLYKRLRLVHLNQYKEAVILYEFDNTAGLDNDFRKEIDLGCFELSNKDTLVLEAEIANAVEQYDLDYSFSFSNGGGVVPYYLKVTEYLLKPNKPLEIENEDFDFLHMSYVMGDFAVNGQKLCYPKGGDYEDGQTIRLFKEDLPKKMELEYKGYNSNGVTLFAVKKVYNRDNFSSYQELLKKVHGVVTHSLRTDYVNTAMKMFLGELPMLERLNFDLEFLAKMNFNERSKGYYDAYEKPVRSALEGVTAESSTASAGGVTVSVSEDA